MDYTHHSNTVRFSKPAEGNASICFQKLTDWQPAIDEIHTWPEYSPQPLHSLPNLASQTGIGKLLLKDESRRFGPSLASFKMLGAPYAVYRILAEEVYKQTGGSVRPSSAELRSGTYRHITEQVTVCVATDGNQGRGLRTGHRYSAVGVWIISTRM